MQEVTKQVAYWKKSPKNAIKSCQIVLWQSFLVIDAKTRLKGKDKTRGFKKFFITRHFPQTAVYPAIGNHEMFPVNMFPDEDQPVPQIYDPSWLYNNLADLYQHWLPDTAQQNTLRDSGYYSVRT